MDQAAVTRARAGIARRGHLVGFKRGALRVDVKAIVRGYSPSQLAPGITVGKRELIVSAQDLEAAGYDVPLRKGDWAYFGEDLDIPAHIDSVDVDHREYQGCYEVTVTGN